MLSPRQMAPLAVILGLSLGKPPEATRLATTTAFGLPRGASSYLARKQQRARITSASVAPVAAARAVSRPPRSLPPPDRVAVASQPSRVVTVVRLGPRGGNGPMPYRLRC